MPVVDLSEEQVVQLVRQLPPERRLALLKAIACDAAQQREARESRLAAAAARVAAERGLSWERLTDEERLALVDDLVHEHRSRT